MWGSLHGSSHILFPHFCPGLHSRGPQTLRHSRYGCLILGDSSTRPSPCLPKAPLKHWEERVPGLQNWKHRPRDKEGKDGAISKSFLSLIGGCDNPCLALFISGLSHHLLGHPSHLYLESTPSPQLTSLHPCHGTRRVVVGKSAIRSSLLVS